MSFGPRLRRHIAGRRLERRLDRPHDVVVLNDLVGTEIGDRHARAAMSHQRLRAAHHADERVDRDIHRRGEALARAVDHPGMEIILGTERHRVETDIDLSPSLADCVEDPRILIVVAHVERQDDAGAELFRERADIFLRLVILIGHRQIGALVAKRLGAAKRDGSALAMPMTSAFLPARENNAEPPLVHCKIYASNVTVQMFGLRQKCFHAWRGRHFRWTGGVPRSSAIGAQEE